MLRQVSTQQAIGMSSVARTTIDATPDVQSAAEVTRRDELRFVWAFWAFIAALTFANALINDDTWHGPRLPAVAPLVTVVVNCLVWGVTTPIMFRLTDRFSLDRPNWMVPLALFLAGGVLYSMGVNEMMRYLEYRQAIHYFGSDHASQPSNKFNPSPFVGHWRFMREYLIYLMVLSGGYAHRYFMRYRVRHQQAQRLEAQAAHFRAALADARLSALRSQLNPHFLFNTLNAVSSLIEKDPRGARRMIADLSELLRDTLDISAREIPLKSELHTVRRYVEIMRTRFGGRLDLSEEVDADVLDALVPPLLLQPLVENAIKHGIEKWGGRESIQVRAVRSGDSLLISVINIAVSASQTALQQRSGGGGVGLQNTRERLRQCYGDQQAVSLKQQTGGCAVVEVSLPFRTHALPAGAMLFGSLQQ